MTVKMMAIAHFWIPPQACWIRLPGGGAPVPVFLTSSEGGSDNPWVWDILAYEIHRPQKMKERCVHPPCETAWRHSFPWDWNFLIGSPSDSDIGGLWIHWGNFASIVTVTKHVGFGARFYILLYISHATFGKLVNLSMPQFTHLENGANNR